jgi:AraC family L-rhamnose operon transcriptional activator RhaR
LIFASKFAKLTHMNSASPAIRMLAREIFDPMKTPIRTTRRVINGNTPLCDRDFLEVAVTVGGSAIERTIYGEEPVKRGDVFILRPGAWHAYLSAKNLEIYECQFGMELLQRELAWTRTDPAMELMFWDTLTSLDRRGVLKMQLSPSTLQRCDKLLAESIEVAKNESSPGRPEEIGRLLQFLGEVGREVLGSVQNLRKGKPQAHQVLLRTNRDISIIGQQVGWSDANYFARRFKAHLGVSATKYRRQFAKIAESSDGNGDDEE